ncbi:hypothetical protein RJ640_010357 [Escallonia rubra]|uniref:Protein FATTY ACID EXPORT 3, chloroplastic n=1 Tax=Escallonia rubra TaxID=112253 RepID=A0AA88UER4_9ASTE|nr:hypothetical protein RJ640_010357 [Escallonia rubra]
MAALCPSPVSLRFESILKPHTYKVSLLTHTAASSRRRLGLRLLRPNRPVLSFAASHEESKPSEFEIQEENSDIRVEAEESEEAWKQTLASFKEQALKMQSVSQEAYELYSKKAVVILKETADRLKIQAEKARQDLSVIATEISEEGKEYLSTAAENSPDEVKDIMETFASTPSNLNDVSKVRDFYFGMPYGALLAFGGFFSFMLTGSISALRFGVILGGTLLALSVLSLKSWKRGESSTLALKGQAGLGPPCGNGPYALRIETIRLTSRFRSIQTIATWWCSGAMVAFYVYRIRCNGEQTKGSNLEPEAEN